MVESRQTDDYIRFCALGLDAPYEAREPAEHVEEANGRQCPCGRPAEEDPSFALGESKVSELRQSRVAH